MPEHPLPRALVTFLWALAVMFFAAFVSGLIPLILSLLGFSGFPLSDTVFTFLWCDVAYWFYRLGAPEAIVSTGSHIGFFTPLGYCLVYLVPGVFLGVIAWFFKKKD